MSAFDLDQFAPAPVKFRKRPTPEADPIEYCLVGDPDVDVVAQMLRIEESIRDSGSVEATAAAVKEGKDLLLRMIVDYDGGQDISQLRLGTVDVLTLFALIMHGGSVAAVVASALTVSGDDAGDENSGVATPGDGLHEGGSGDGDAPLASVLSSSTRSSSSDDSEDGLPATGLA